jgi:predicted NBD/HSP70 family sugar kinase
MAPHAAPPASQAALRRHNLGLVLQTVAARGKVSRAAVAAATGLTRATISTLVDELLAAGLVIELGAQRPGTVGRPGTALAPAATGPAGVGAEVGVDHLAACVVDLRGDVRVRQVVGAQNRGRPAERVLAELAELLWTVAERAAELDLRPAGLTVAVPGLVGRDRRSVLRAPNLGWEDVPVADLVDGAAAGAPVTVDNEANLGALAELWLGGHDATGPADTEDAKDAKDAKNAAGAPAPLAIADFIHVSAAIGIGAALVVDGDLFRGSRGFAGELGHVTVHPDGPGCSCGSRGCLEQYAGEEAVLRAAGIAPERPDALVALRAAAAAHDRAALRALTAAGEALGIALSGAVNVLDPQAVVLGGPLAELAPWLRPALDGELGRRVTDRHWPADAVRVSRLGRDGVMLGAAHSAVRTVLADPAAWSIRERAARTTP